MSKLLYKFYKQFGRTVGGILLTALLFSISVSLEASARQGYQPETGSGYYLAVSATLTEAKSDSPTDNIELPDYLTPRTGGFILPSTDELAKAAILPVSDPADDPQTVPANSQPEDVEAFQVPENDSVSDSYFADTVFIGDSRIVGLMTYSGVKSYYYAKVSLNIFSVLHTTFLSPSDSTKSDTQLTVLQALEKYPNFKKVYICFGINELGYSSTAFINAYEYFLDQVMALMPNATFYVQGVFPVTAAQSAKNRYGVNNDAVIRTNKLLLELAKKKKVNFVNIYEQFAGTDGALDPALTSDGIHLNKAGIKLQMDYLRTHTIK